MYELNYELTYKVYKSYYYFLGNFLKYKNITSVERTF